MILGEQTGVVSLAEKHVNLEKQESRLVVEKDRDGCPIYSMKVVNSRPIRMNIEAVAKE